MQERDYPVGLDFGWIAADREGRVAVFITAGQGPVPTLTLVPQRPPVEDSESRLDVLPPITSAELLVPLKRPDDFVKLARRGLFVYDWTDADAKKTTATNSYELIAVPGVPISVGNLPKDVTLLLEGIVLNVSFTRDRSIDVTQHLDCRRPPP